MKKIPCLLSLAALLGATAASSAIVIDFLIPSSNTGTTRLGFANTFNLDFTIDGSGNVTLDAVPAAALTTQAAIDAINSWDGPVGTVADASLFGTTFTLTATGNKVGVTAAGITGDGQFGSANGLLGISGDNASRIDGLGGARESLTFTLSTSNPNLQLTMTQVVVGSQGGTDVAISADSTSVEFTNVTTVLNSNVVLDVASSGLAIANGGVFAFTNDLAGAEVNGYGLDSFTLTAVPEPATVALLMGMGTLGLVLWRRRRRDA